MILHGAYCQPCFCQDLLCLMDLCQAVVRQPDLADLAGLGQRDDLFDPSWRIERIMDSVIIHLLAPKQMRADLKHLTDRILSIRVGTLWSELIRDHVCVTRHVPQKPAQQLF